MSQYELVEVSAVDSNVIYGYVIKKVGLDKLDGTNIYAPEERGEAEKFVREQNERADIQRYMPLSNDPEVWELLNDPNFSPVEYEEVEVPDWDNSTVVHVMKPGPQVGRDENGNPIWGPDEVKYDEVGKPMIDFLRSTIVTKWEKQPIGVSNKSRIDLAREEVARRRRTRDLSGNTFT